MSALLKNKLSPKSKSPKPPKPELSPGEKQAKRREGRMDPKLLALWASQK